MTDGQELAHMIAVQTCVRAVTARLTSQQRADELEALGRLSDQELTVLVHREARLPHKEAA